MKPAGKAWTTSSLHEGVTSVRGAWSKHREKDPNGRAGTPRKFAPRASCVESSDSVRASCRRETVPKP